MTIAFIALGVIALLSDVVLVWQLKQANQRLVQTTEMFERIVERQFATTQHSLDEERKERDKLAQRIQAPEIATIPEIEQAPAYVPADDFKGLNDQRDRLSANNG